MTTTPNAFMARAIALSLENVQQRAGGPFAAVVVKDGTIVAEGANEVTATNDPTAHAEVVAIRAACRKLNVFRFARLRDLYAAANRARCASARFTGRVPARVYYANSAADAARAGFDDAFIYQEISRPHPERQIPMIQLVQDGALAAFRAWQEKEDKIRY